VLLDSDAARVELIQKASQFAELIQSRGIDLSAYNTNENADDVNELRLGLGAAKVVIWGHSYGSHLGLAVLKRHGPSIERADSWWSQTDRISAGAIRRDLEELIDRVDLRIAEFPKLRGRYPHSKSW
jgi:pimeloyl-ACP methyl ester carboxylesterase